MDDTTQNKDNEHTTSLQPITWLRAKTEESGIANDLGIYTQCDMTRFGGEWMGWMDVVQDTLVRRIAKISNKR
ncbi:hypothetical protein TNCV_2106261 [Trichonephila clavipes]|nr:hypothetical protein TNCV_2106261 [Trichonephila clavipes]